MELEVGCFLSYECLDNSSIILTISPQASVEQMVKQSHFQTTPLLIRENYTDYFGNQTFRIVPSAGYVEIHFSAQVSLMSIPQVENSSPEPMDPSQFPLDVIPFLWPSRYCQSDLLVDFAEQITHGRSGCASVVRICDWIYENVEYRYGTTNERTSAYETLTQCVGVCRDFAHLGIALCRAAGIPARFISGYANKLDPPDFHAYFEAFLDGDWHVFDATRKAPIEGFVRIAVGRDATDVSFANLFGNIEMKEMKVWCEQIH